MRKQRKLAEHTEQQIDALRERVLSLRARREQLASRATQLAGATAKAVMMADPAGDGLALQRDEAVAALRTIEGELARAEGELRDVVAPRLASIKEEMVAYDRRMTTRQMEIRTRLTELAEEASGLVSEAMAMPAAYAHARDELEQRASDVVSASLATLSADLPPRTWQRVGLAVEAMALEKAALMAAQV